MIDMKRENTLTTTDGSPQASGQSNNGYHQAGKTHQNQHVLAALVVLTMTYTLENKIYKHIW